MSQAKSTVQVSIVAQLGQGFNAAFQSADKRLQAFGKTVSETSKAVGNIDAYRKQADAVKQAGYQWQAAKIKADQFRESIKAQGEPTRKQAAELNRLDAAVGRAGEKFAKQRAQLGELARELQKAGVNTGKLTAEYVRLKAELDKTKASQDKLEASLLRQQKIVNAMGATWRGIASAGAGIVAAGAVLSGPNRTAMTYDEQLTYMADTASAGQGPQAFRSNKRMIAEGINAALDYGGGKREDTARALNTLIASGKFPDLPDALNQLKSVTRTAFASGASSDDIANAAIALKNFGINDPGSQFDKLLRAGQLGSAELKNLAKYLPEQLSLARVAGYSGEKGLTDILAFNQVATSTAGSADKAGNNVINLLKKLSSREFSDSIAKAITVQQGDPTSGKKGSFDWTTYAMRQKEKGVPAIESFVGLAERQVQSDPRYKALQKKLESAKGDVERLAIYADMSNILSGSALGQIIADQEALLGGLAAIYQKKEMADLKVKIDGASGAVAGSSANVRGELWAKQLEVANAAAEANRVAFESASGPLAKILETGTSLAEQFPKLTAAAYAAAVALAAVAAMGIVGNGAGKLLRGGAAGGAAGAGAGAAVGASRLGTALKIGGPALAVAGSGLAAYSIATNPNLSAAEKKASYTGLGGGLAGAGAGALAGGMVGGPVGALVGGVVGGFGGSMLGDWAGTKMFSESAAKSAADAATAASQAAATAQNRPNVTQQNNYTVTVTAPPDSGALELSDQIQRMLRENERRRDAELRGSFFGQPAY